MPFTPTHMIAVLPLARVRAIPFSALALGSMVPDFPLYFRIDNEGNPFCLEASLFCCFAPNSVICLMADATGRPELQPHALFKTLLRRAAGRKADLNAPQLLGSKPKPVAASSA